MAQRYLLDTNIVIGYLRKELPDTGMTYVSNIVDKIPNISAISKIEILRFNTTPENYRVLADFVAEAAIYSVSDAIVDITVVLCRKNKIKVPDAIIAATCLVEQMILLTRNTADFKNIPELHIENPWKV
ncbi:MAG: type II toxin-antitoxin system VapC family toxin [Candidatus Margulisbacteria bacterium]|jgi:predicted nucleic acid-binding protein|nr:type II toxin-antitoxin system VapC family toxin [Candidatus Margulisiibacteriota bacterium]